MKLTDCVYMGLPVVLWPLSFIVFQQYFIYAMAVSTAILAGFTLLRHRKSVFWKSKNPYFVVLSGLVAAAILYAIFYAGYLLTLYLTGSAAYVVAVYTLIGSAGSPLVIGVLLVLIGIFEEVYWRGGLQGFVSGNKNPRGFLFGVLYYAGVHIATLNPILVLAAFFVGLITALTARKYGITASIIAHVVWIEAIVILLPVVHI